MSSDPVDSVVWMLKRHDLAMRGVLAVVAMFALAAVLNAVWRTALGNVIAGLLIVFGATLAVVMLVVGASMGIRKMRRNTTN